MIEEVFLKNFDGISNVYMTKAKNTGDVDLDYLFECKAITKKLYSHMKGKDIYEIVYRYVDDLYPSASGWWFKNKQERDEYWSEEINKYE